MCMWAQYVVDYQAAFIGDCFYFTEMSTFVHPFFGGFWVCEDFYVVFAYTFFGGFWVCEGYYVFALQCHGPDMCEDFCDFEVDVDDCFSC